MEIINVEIGYADVTFENHGILIFSLMFLWGSSAQGFPGLHGGALNWYHIEQVLKTLEINSVSKLKGSVCRIKRNNGLVIAIGHITKDKWFTW